MVLNLVKNNKAVKKICEKNGITFLGVFGSIVRGEDNEQSDIDLLISFAGKKACWTLLE